MYLFAYQTETDTDALLPKHEAQLAYREVADRFEAQSLLPQMMEMFPEADVFRLCTKFPKMSFRFGAGDVDDCRIIEWTVQNGSAEVVLDMDEIIAASGFEVGDEVHYEHWLTSVDARPLMCEGRIQAVLTPYRAGENPRVIVGDKALEGFDRLRPGLLPKDASEEPAIRSPRFGL